VREVASRTGTFASGLTALSERLRNAQGTGGP
jgi:hypothetical protein